MSASAVKSPSRAHSVAFYVGLGIVGQFIWGSYPVFGKGAIEGGIPKFSMLFIATSLVLLLSVWLVRRQDDRPWREIVHMMLHARALWGVALFVVLRSVSNLLAMSMTRATWVQLIYLLTPFTVAILGSLLFGEWTPRYTYRALLISTLGAAMVLIEDWHHVFAGFTRLDGWGLLLAFFSMLALAIYFLMIRRSARSQASNGLIMLQQSIAVMTTYLILTLVTGEDWGQWLTVSRATFFYALLVIFLVQIGGNTLQITAISGASPALITSFMPLRLISAIVLGWLVLGEELHTVWQWIGAGTVLVTVSVYLWLQSRDAFQRILG